jgi:hypothetical protein
MMMVMMMMMKEKKTPGRCICVKYERINTCMMASFLLSK